MIKFDKNELKYIKETFTQAIDNTEKLKDEELTDYVRGVGEDSIQVAKEFLTFDDINIVNNDEELNKKVSDAVYWICGMWTWEDNDYSEDEVSEYINEKEYCSIYGKIIDEDSEDDEEEEE